MSFFGLFKGKQPLEALNVDSQTIVSPMQGKRIELGDVQDEVFGSGVFGEGLAIVPSLGEVYAPVAGVVEAIFPTKHAITIRGNNGVEILIHIGINTVELNGQHYESQVRANDQVEAGDLLMKFDVDAIKKAGYDITTPVIFVNGEEFQKTYLDVHEVQRGTPIIRLG